MHLFIYFYSFTYYDWVVDVFFQNSVPNVTRLRQRTDAAANEGWDAIV